MSRRIGYRQRNKARRTRERRKVQKAIRKPRRGLLIRGRMVR